MDISTQHCAEDKAMVSSFPFRCVGRISYILEIYGIIFSWFFLIFPQFFKWDFWPSPHNP